MPDQGLETLIISSVAGHQVSLIARHVASNGFALFAALEAVVRSIEPLAHDTELARFHAFDLGDLLEECLRCRMSVHAHSIYPCIYTGNKILLPYLSAEWRLAPEGGWPGGRDWWKSGGNH